MRKQSPPRSSAGSALKGLGYLLFLFLALAIGTAGGWIRQSEGLTNLVMHVFSPKKPEETFNGESVNLLILGCDEDLAPGGKKVLKKQARSDMMLIVKLDFKNNLVTGVSIPRDTRVKLPGYRSNKINAYHNIAKKGQEAALTQKAVEFLLPGIHIDRVVTLDFDHFQDLVNLVGGVPINIEKRMHYTDKAGSLYIDLKPGFRTLNGYDAMTFVRFRHGDSDLQRQERQKQFLASFKQQALKNWTKVPSLIEEGQRVLGGGLTTDEISSLALFARQVPPANIQWGQLPVKDIPGSTDLKLDEDKVEDVLIQYRLIEKPKATAPVEGGKP